jgi:hypothetical protein
LRVWVEVRVEGCGKGRGFGLECGLRVWVEVWDEG